ncbi:MAG: ABC transporter permease subunit [Gemmataceae bacterium]|nr:ABC transporter permease subunit [Gemmataceae bacterium]MDW8266162.1 ABC transporter permease subunit [Gemmataceae bacterium]
MEARKSFTGHARRRRTGWGVRVGEVVSRLCITVGGIGTIAAVGMVCVFLVWVVYPLFRGATITEAGAQPRPERPPPLRWAVDEQQVLAWELSSEGVVEVFRLDDGRVLDRRVLCPPGTLTAVSPPGSGDTVAFGFRDGTIRLARLGFATRFYDEQEIPSALRGLVAGDYADFEGGLLTRSADGQWRGLKLRLEMYEPIRLSDPTPVRRIDVSLRPTGPVVSVLTEDGRLRTTFVSRRENLLTGEVVQELLGGELTLPRRGSRGLPDYLLLSGIGDSVYAIWDDGHLLRVSTQDLEEPTIAESRQLVDVGESITAVQFLIGKTTLIVGDSTGRVRAWFGTRPKEAATSDGTVLVAAHEFAGHGSAVTALASSARTRLLAVGHADGQVRLWYVTSDKDVGSVTAAAGLPVRGLALAPRDDGLLAEGAGQLRHWRLDLGHPEVTFRALARPVWYEGYPAPAHVWQSSSGSDAFEPKFGMWPLVFGTLKATFYSLLLGVPLALLAAIYTSEFLHPQVRALVKPTIELMASLPSVVLGFLAALVFAPFVEHVLPAVLAALLTVPGAFLLGAYVWQFLPEKLAVRMERHRFLYVIAALPMGIGLAAVVGPWLESALFQGDFKAWLAGSTGSAANGWMMLLLPLAALGTAFVLAQFVNPLLRPWTAQESRLRGALVELAKFLLAAAATVAAAWLAGTLLDAAGFDPRGSIVGTYVQRNALVVGFIMGFAIIPIIYTIAEDALTAVPEHLRSASLGCGATPWQTAHRIIIPTAMSGLFSAVMIGLGRAVGETMIVLMATGNTPIIDLNIFNGFRTLSANIAVEMPEAVRGSTHFRTLFLAALVLFAMTFVLNTIAEVVRLRFRRRAYQL